MWYFWTFHKNDSIAHNVKQNFLICHTCQILVMSLQDVVDLCFSLTNSQDHRTYSLIAKMQTYHIATTKKDLLLWDVKLAQFNVWE